MLPPFNLKNKVIYLVICVYTLLLIFSISQPDLIGDEGNYHYPLVKKYIDEFPRFDFANDYSSASTPLPYILLSTIGQIIPLNIVLIRIINIVISFFTFILFYQILFKLGYWRAEYLSLLLLFNPYFLRTSAVFYTSIWGLFFAILSIYCIINDQLTSKWLLVGIFSALAILSRQFYLMLPASFIIYWLIEYRKGRSSIPDIIMYLIPQISYIILFLYWEGIVGPNFKAHEILLKPMNLIYMMILVGFYFSWYLLTIKKYSIKKYWPIILFIPLFFIFQPAWDSHHSAEKISGLVIHLAQVISSQVEFGGTLFLFLLFTAGSVLIIYKFRDLRFTSFNIFIISNLFFLCLIMLNNKLSGERHYLSSFPFLILWFFKDYKGEMIKYVLPIYGVLSIVYTYYFLYLAY